jgi:charged multivesicular body protein 7
MPHEINPIDRGILELKSAVENLYAQVDGLQHKIDEFSPIFSTSLQMKMNSMFRCTQKASTALRQQHKAVALSHLRSRKQLDELLTKRLSSLHTLESTFIRVEAAAGDVEVRISSSA